MGCIVQTLYGTDTSDANATAAQILSGKTAYVNGVKITGNISLKAAATITPGTSNQTIASGQYLSGTQTIKGDANLVTDNIKSGVSIFGVSGKSSVVDTSDATATAATIRTGYTAYKDGSKITGTVATQAAQTITPGTSDKTITSPKFLTGTQTIKGDANLVAANIKSGTSIFGISGTFTSDATATANNISSGKTAYVNGAKITGTREITLNKVNNSSNLSVARSSMAATTVGNYALFAGGFGKNYEYKDTVDIYYES